MSLTRERNRRAIAKRPHPPAHVACPRSSRPVLSPGGAADRDIFQPANEASVGGGLPPCHAVGEKGGVAVGGRDPGVECLLIWSCTELPLPAKDEAIRTILSRYTAFLYRLEEHIFYSILPLCTKYKRRYQVMKLYLLTKQLLQPCTSESDNVHGLQTSHHPAAAQGEARWLGFIDNAWTQSATLQVIIGTQ